MEMHGMSLFKRLLGGSKKTPEQLESIAEIDAALTALRAERDMARKEMAGIGDKRRTLLADDTTVGSCSPAGKTPPAHKAEGVSFAAEACEARGPSYAEALL